MSKEKLASLNELLLSAETEEDLLALEQLMSECGEHPEAQDQPPQPQTKAVGSGGARWVASTLSEVAEFFGLAVQTVKQWRTESPPMPGDRGNYPLNEIVKWRERKLSQSDLTAAKKQADLEAVKVTTEQRRLELAKDRGEVVEIAEVERWAATALIECREMVMQLPQMIAGASPPEIRDFARDETDRHCRAVLTMLRRRLDSDEVTSGAAPGTATEN